MIQEIYNKLPAKDKDALVIAYNNRDSYLLSLDGNRFIGVWVVPSDCLQVIETANNWYYGRKICNE